LVIAEVPLLYEVGREVDFDRVVFVDAPESVRLERLVTTRGLDEAEAHRLMAAQGNPVAKRGRAHHVVVNDGTLRQLHERADAVLERLRAEAEGEESSRSASTPTMRLDLHMHTRGSWDCLSDPEKVLAAARARGVERIAITDHNRLHVALEMAAKYPEHVIPGEEVKTAEGIDVIGLYLHTAIPEGTSAAETCRLIREQGGITYLPHPYARGKGGSGRYAEELAPLCEVIEVFNARLHPGRLNEPADDLASRHRRLRGAGSDAHTVREVAGAWVEVPVHPNTPDGLRAALSQGTVHGTTASNLVHLASTWAKIRKKLPGGV
ncbi:MAG: dephospho-CoA kinase, partial [Gemmatimonadetes bacterium]|nr:dephospho-CoA kinase [Gemmatimonadota bacterium]